MQSIEIQINGQRADVDKSRLPLVFSRKIDLWDSFIGSEGTQAKSLNDTLYLPATRNNSNILANFDIYSIDSTPAQDLLFIQVFVNAQSVFAGYGQRVSVSKIGTQSDSFAIKILGDSTDVFTQLAELSLRDLPMGDAPTAPADINASWVALSMTNNPLIFAPAFYGGITYNGATSNFDNGTYLQGLRPVVRIWRILEAIFERQFGYEIVSNFYNTEAFRNLVYPFGVGDAWVRSDAVAATTCYVGSNNQGFTPPINAVKFLIETAPYSDPLALNNFGEFEPTAYGAGWYVFTFKINTNNVNKIVLRGQNANGVVNINLGEYEPNTLIITDPICFEPLYGLKKMNIHIEGAPNPSISQTVFIDTYYKAQLISRFAYGQPLRIASCLHDRTQKDFLRGLQHAFGLVIAIDNINKRVYIDPRFNNATQPAVVPEGLFNYDDGYYNTAADAEVLEVDISETTLQHRRPFGDTLTLSYGEDSGDAYYAYAKEQGDYSIKPLMGSLLTFIASDKKGTLLPNPFFTYLLNIRIQSSTSIPRQTVMPCMITDLELAIISNDNAFLPAKFECAPKLAMYYGVLDFGTSFYGNYNQFGFKDYVGISNDLAVNIIPSFFQVFPDSASYFAAFNDIPFNLSYATLTYNNSPTPNFAILGLIDRYHSKYLSIIYNDKWYSLTAKVDLSTYRADLFNAPKMFSIGGQLIKGWQVSTESFNPTQSDKADIIVIGDYDNIKSFTYAEESNDDIPLLTVGYIFELTV
jgi:hypothetical protein